MTDYIHGYTVKEQERLLLQNQHLSPFIYKNINLSGASNLLEVGCGVGAQMIYILRHYPNIHVTGVDISIEQVKQAEKNIIQAGIPENRFAVYHTNDFTHKYHNSFDSMLLVWVLEHIENPIQLLRDYKYFLKEKAIVYFTEVFNSSLYIYPSYESIINFWDAINKLQRKSGGNGNAGIHLWHYLKNAGYQNITRMVYPLLVDESDPVFKRKHFDYWKNLMLSSKDLLVANNMLSQSTFDQFIKDMDLVKNDPRGCFSYSIMQARAEV